MEKRPRIQGGTWTFTASWSGLLVVGIAILAFGVVLLALPSSTASSRAIGAASIGMGLFGSAMTLGPFRRRERWTWWCLWYYPAFWVAHLAGGLPPGQDHIHQVAFIAISTGALLIAFPDFFP